MARRTTAAPPPEEFEENITDIDVADEMRGSYLEYAYSTIYQRALPDARDDTLSPADFKGKKKVVLFWFPKALTRG